MFLFTSDSFLSFHKQFADNIPVADIALVLVRYLAVMIGLRITWFTAHHQLCIVLLLSLYMGRVAFLWVALNFDPAENQTHKPIAIKLGIVSISADVRVTTHAMFGEDPPTV